MIAALIMLTAAVLVPAALVGLVSLALKATDNAADDIADSDRAASMAEFQTFQASFHDRSNGR